MTTYRYRRPLAVIAGAAAAVAILTALVIAAGPRAGEDSGLTEEVIEPTRAPITFTDVATWDGLVTLAVTEPDVAADPLPDGRNVHWCRGQIAVTHMGSLPAGAEVTYSCAISGTRSETGVYALPATAPAPGSSATIAVRAMGSRYFAEPVTVTGSTLRLASGDEQTVAGVIALRAAALADPGSTTGG